MKVKQQGFAALEAVLIVFAISLITGLGLFVLSQNNNPSDNYSSPAARKVPSEASKKTGNTATVEKLTQLAADDEIAIDDELANEAATDALDDQAVIDAVGEGVDESIKL